MEAKIIGEIPRNSTEKTIVSISEYKGKTFVDARVYYDADGEYKPTKKGITVQPDALDTFIGLLQKAKTELSSPKGKRK